MDEFHDRQRLRQRVVIDTSVLIADPECVHSFHDTDVVIPLTVIEEPTASRTDPTTSAAACSALRTLEQLRLGNGGSLAEPVAVGSGTLRIEINGVHKHRLIEHGLTRRPRTTASSVLRSARPRSLPRR